MIRSLAFRVFAIVFLLVAGTLFGMGFYTSRWNAIAALVIAATLGGLAALLVGRPLSRTVRALAEAARGVRAGRRGVRVSVGPDDELGDLARTFNEMAAELERARARESRLLGETARALDEAVEELARRLEALGGEAAAGPVWADRGAAAGDAALGGEEEPTGPEPLAELRRNALRIERLVEDLEDLSGVTGDEEPGEVDAVAAARRVASAVVSSAEASSDGRGVGIEVRRRPWRETPGPGEGAGGASAEPIDGPIPARIDAGRLERILRRLLERALSRSRADARVLIEVRRLGSAWVQVDVADEGPTVPPEELESLWDSEARLAIVKRLVEGEGGRAWAESRPGTGSVLHVTVPAA